MRRVLSCCVRLLVVCAPVLSRAADLADIARVCGVTLPLPACDPGRPVLVEEGRDCSIGDTIPGNGQCDLATGTYGALRIENHGSLVLGTGTTVLCSLIARSYVRI